MQDSNPHDPARHALDDQRQEEARAAHTRDQTPQREARDYSGGPGFALGPDDDDLVSEASAESFPASDPPSWTPERV